MSIINVNKIPRMKQSRDSLDWKFYMEYSTEEELFQDFLQYYKSTHHVRNSFQSECKLSTHSLNQKHFLRIQYFYPKTEMGTIKEYFLIEKSH